MGGKGSTQAKLPTPGELGPLLELQSKYNRVGVETPFGSQKYTRNPDGSYNMITDIGDEGKGLVSRAVGLGMTDSARQSAPGQMNGIAGALASRIGQRMGLEYGNHPIQLAQDPFHPSAHAVVDRRNAVQHDQRHAINRHADRLQQIAASRCDDDQPDRPAQRQQGAAQVSPGVETFSVIHRLSSRLAGA